MAEETCGNCQRPIKAGAKFCAACGAPIGALPARTARLTALVPANGPLLQIQDAGQTSAVTLGGKPLLLGRAPDNDIVLASQFVSAHHARLDPEGTTHQITDLGSTNGVLFEGQPIAPNAPLLLSDGATLRIGDPTTGNFVTLLYRNPRVPRPLRAPRGVPRYVLDPQDPQVTIGRTGNNIVLDNPQVSRQHALIERADGGHLLRDLGATNGTFVNGQRVTQHLLTPGDIIQIGAFKLVYDGQSLEQIDQRGALRIDARGLSRTVSSAAGPRPILRDVSLTIAPREFVALVGGSGAGKSTLLGALSGYAPADAGQVLVNGDDLYQNFDAYRTLLGYVPQDDIIHRALPLERALGYAAELRLPEDTGPDELTARVDAALADVELLPQRATPIEALSGGQRKRASIAAELLADPALFFLDEPTSGLDPGLEKKLMYTLRRLADGGRTVVLVTHATANIAQCDHVAFLAGGRLVFFGPPEDALRFFRVGSGEFAEIYTKLDGLADPADPERWAVVRRDVQAEFDRWQAQHPAAPPPPLAELWEQKFRAAPEYAAYIGRGSAPADAASVPRRVRPGAQTLLTQLRTLVWRNTDLLAQDRRNLLFLLLQAPAIGALLALVSKPGAMVGPDAYASEAKKILLMLATVAVWFGVINAARQIAGESAIYRRERLARLRIGPYILAKLVPLGLLVALQSTLLLALVALRVTLPLQGVFLPAWLELLVTTVLTGWAGLGLGLAISAAAYTPDRATSLVPLALIPQILFAGVIFGLGDSITPQRVLSWLTASRWAMDAYGATVALNDLPLQPGMLRLSEPPVEYLSTPQHLANCWGLLLLNLLCCIGLTGLALRRLDRRVVRKGQT